MRGSRWLGAVIAVGAVSTGVAVAGSGQSETLPVNGDFHADVVGTPKERQCDANHLKSRVRFEGPQESNDARLVGDLEVNTRTVVNTSNGWGYTTGSVVIRKTDRHRVKFRGQFEGVFEPDGDAEGFLTGWTSGHKSMRLLANFNVDQHEDGSITGEFGKDSQTQKPYAPEDEDPAVLTNACLDHGHGGHDDGDDDDGHH